MKVHYSSKTDNWATPQDYFDKVSEEFGPFTLDPCADADNAKAPDFYTTEQDGLQQTWAPHTVWMNPPYGREIPRWVEKAWAEAGYGATVVCLIPSRTDTRWWHDFIMKADLLRFVKGRLKFGGAKHSAPFPCALAVFKSRCVDSPL